MKSKTSNLKPLLVLFILAFVLRLGVLAFTHSYLEPDYFIDVPRYDALGLAKAQQWKGGETVDIQKVANTRSLGFYYWIAGLYSLFGHAPLLVKLFNVFFGAIVPVIVYLIAERIFSKKAAFFSAGLTVIFPSMVFWSTVMLKDTIVVLLSSLLILLSLQINYVSISKNLKKLFAVSFLIYLFTWFREYTAIILAVSIVLYTVIKFSKSLKRETIVPKIIVCIILFMLLGTALDLAGYGFFGISYARFFGFKSIDDIRSRMAGGNSDFSVGVSVDSAGKAFSYLPSGISYFLFSPFPWKTTKLLEHLMIPEMIIFYLLSPFILYGTYYSIRYKFRESNILLFFILANIILYSLVEVNLGTLVRHRIQILPYFFILGFAGLKRLYARVYKKLGRETGEK